MNLARGLERRLENLVDGASATMFKGRMHPVDIGSKVLRQLDFLAKETVAGPQVPNVLTVRMNPSDLDPNADHHELRTELERVVTEMARENGWRLVGPATITVSADPRIPKGVLACDGKAAPGPLPVWAHLIADDGSAVLNITHNRSLIGRALDCDIRIINEQISRHHAVVATQGDAARILDLGSSNGTFVNRAPIGKTAQSLAPGDNVVLGDLSFTYRLAG